MDFNTIKSQVQNLTLNDIKKGVRSVQNVVMNLTETESKVREATTNDPWGAGSSLMREIAEVSRYTEDRIQIMNMIDRRFHEKGPQEWRQIYKALQLLDYLIRNGDQEVVNSALDIHRMRILKVMKQSFHALDPEGKDVGLNVRILAGNILTLLQDTTAIREARREAMRNRNKYVGVSSESYNNRPSRYSSNRNGGFNSQNNADRFGTSAMGSQIRGDGGIYGHRPSPDEYDEDDMPSSSRTTTTATTSRARNTTKTTQAAKPVPSPKPAVPAIDLLDIGFDDGPAANTTSQASKATTSAPLDDDDDFDDFQTASAPSTSAPAPKPASTLPPVLAPTKPGSNPSLLASKPVNVMPSSLLNLSAPVTSTVTPNLTAGSTATMHSLGASTTKATQSTGLNMISPNPASKPQIGMGSQPKPASGDAFGDLLSSAGFKKQTGSAMASKGGQQSLAAMNKKQLDDKLWGAAASAPAPVSANSGATPQNRPSGAAESLIDLF